MHSKAVAGQNAQRTVKAAALVGHQALRLMPSLNSKLYLCLRTSDGRQSTGNVAAGDLTGRKCRSIIQVVLLLVGLMLSTMDNIKS